MKRFFKSWPIVLGLFSSLAWAQADFPNKPLRMIVPFPPGGVTDIVARTVSVKLSADLGQPIVVENRAGASGAIGAELGARAPADGYTLIMGNISTLAINSATFAKLGYDPVTSFDPVSMVAVQPLLITVHPGVAAKTLGELVQLAKNQPGQLNYGTAGSSIHLAVEQFNSLAGIRMNHIAYKGSAPAITDLVGGQIQVLFDPFSSIYPQVAAGKARALAVTTDKRASAAPQLPTVAEQGYAGFDVSSWQGIVVPAGTPKSVVQRLHRGLANVMASAEVKDKFSQYSAMAVATSPEEFSAYIKQELVRWKKVAQQAGVKPE
ncbi:tripartite tricarboxylate transporter substrate binding protein [Limnohabitans sp. WS1]|uniref:Bug family tripartite tricarboxylate transporter substrate binding protein n=1 Tax=Limnohabitans sp. WS1 TaxID=1100726 RepID=UPI001304C7FF|nr:tripartite tricarboxylate transporter substrate binding protein [Limnohabitans sp. WS1]